MRIFPPNPITALIDDQVEFNLAESFGQELSVADVGADESLAAVRLGYGTSTGNTQLRELVASQLAVPTDHVVITTGAASAIFLVALLTSDKDGAAVIHRPGFPPMFDALVGLGTRVVESHSRFEQGYRLDIEDLASKLSATTRLVLLTSPQNPSGVALTKHEVEGVLAAMSHTCPDAALLIDETYREATYGQAPPATTFAGVAPNVLTCSSLSKAHGAPGLRVGWLTVADPYLREQIRASKFNSVISCGSLDEHLALQLLQRADQILEPRRTAAATGLRIVEEWAAENPDHISYLPPDAGAFCCLKLREEVFGIEQVQQFHTELAHRGVMVAQGPWFGDSPHVIRLGFAYQAPAALTKALTLVRDALTDCA